MAAGVADHPWSLTQIAGLLDERGDCGSPCGVRPRSLNPEEVAERDNDPTELTRRVYRRPWLAGLASGSLIAAWVLLLRLPWPLAVGTGIALTLFTGFMWRPGGPAQRLRRYVLRRFPKTPPSN